MRSRRCRTRPRVLAPTRGERCMTPGRMGMMRIRLTEPKRIPQRPEPAPRHATTRDRTSGGSIDSGGVRSWRDYPAPQPSRQGGFRSACDKCNAGKMPTPLPRPKLFRPSFLRSPQRPVASMTRRQNRMIGRPIPQALETPLSGPGIDRFIRRYNHRFMYNMDDGFDAREIVIRR